MPDMPVRRADIGLLFGARHGVEEICRESYALWQQRLFDKLVISGGRTHGENESEASVIGTTLLELGMPNHALIREHEATNTGQNVILSRKNCRNFRTE